MSQAERKEKNMKALWSAVRFLTIFLPLEAFQIAPERLGSSTAFFPLVGFSLGLILVCVNWLLDPYLASEIVSVVLVAVLIFMNRAQHLEGLRSSFDGLRTRSDRTTGIFGLLAVLIVVALKFRAIEVMGEPRSQGLLLAPVLGRWAMVVLAYGSESGDDSLGQILVEHVRAIHLLFATATTIAAVAFFAGRIGLWIGLWTSLFALVSRSLLHRRPGGLSGEHFGAVEEISETLALVLFASL